MEILYNSFNLATPWSQVKKLGNSAKESRIVRLALYLMVPVHGAAYEVKHAYVHFTTKSENIKVFVRLFQRAISFIYPWHEAEVREQRNFLEGFESLSLQINTEELPELSNPEFLRNLSELKREGSDFDISEVDLKTATKKSSVEHIAAYRSYIRLLSSIPDARVSESFVNDLNAAIDRERDFLEQFDHFSLGRERQDELIEQNALALSDQIRHLNRGDKILYFGEMSSRGRQIIPSFFSDLIKSEIGEKLYTLLFEETDEEVIKELKETIFNHMSDQVPAMRVATGTTSEIASKLVAALEKVLPDCVYQKLSKETKKDILELMIGRSPNIKTLEFLLGERIDRAGSTEEAADRLWDLMCEQGLDQLLEQRLETLLLNLLEYGKESVHEQVESSIHKLTHQLPKVALEVLNEVGLETCQDHYWMEIERVDDRYQLSLYTRSLGTDIHRPYKFQGETGYHLPLVFDRIKPEKLDRTFFQRLLTYRVWPSIKEGASYSLDDLYEYLCGHLSDPKARDAKSSYPDSRTILDNISDWVRLYHFQKSELGRKDFQRLHDLTIPYHILIHFWPKVVQDPSLLEQATLRDTIRTLGNEIAQGAMQIQLDEETEKKVYATLWEVNETLQQYEQKAAKIKHKAARVIPGEVREYLTSLFKQFGVSEQTVDLVKDLATAVMGDEFAPIIDELIEEILPGIPPAPEGVAPPWKSVDINKAIPTLQGVRHVRLSPLYALKAVSRLFDILYWIWSLTSKVKYLAGTLAILVPYLKDTELGARGIALLMVLFGPERVKRLLPASVYEAVCAVFGLVDEVYSYLKWRFLICSLKVASAVLLKDHHINSVKNAVQSVSAQVTHRENLTLELPANVETLGAKFRFKIREPRPFLEESDPGILIAQSALLNPNFTFIDRGDLESQLSEWNNHLSLGLIDDPRLRELTLNSWMRSLPLPKEPGGDIWQQNPRLLPLLSDLLHKQHKLAKANQIDSNQEFFERITTTYALYACIHGVALGCDDAHIPTNIHPNGEALIPWMNDPLLVIHNPRTDRQFNAVLDYFDLNRHITYTKHDITAYLSDRFFDHRNRGKVLGFPMIISNKLLFRGMLTSNDCCYYNYLLNEGKIQDLLTDRGVTEKHHRLTKLMHMHIDAPKVSKRSIGRRILPYPFYLLRLAHYMANEIMSWEPQGTQGSAQERQSEYLEAIGFHMGHPPPPGEPPVEELVKNPETTWEWIKQKTTKLYHWAYPVLQEQKLYPNLPLFPKDKEVSLSRKSKRLRGHDFPLYQSEELNDITRYFKLILRPSRRSQSEIMTQGDSKYSDPYPEFIRQLKMVNQDPSSTTVRAFSLFLDHKHRLSSACFMVLFDLFINNRKSLDLQLNERVGIVEYFGSSLGDLLNYFEKREDWKTYLILTKVGHELMLYCQNYEPNARRYFPDFADLIREKVCLSFRERRVSKRQFETAEDGLIASYLYLVSLYSHLDPSDVKDEHKQQIMMNIARLGFSRIPWDWDASEFGNSDQGLRAKEAIYRWRKEVVSALKYDPDFQQMVLDGLLEDILEDVPEGDWHGSYPTFHKGKISFDLFKKPKIGNGDLNLEGIPRKPDDEVIVATDNLIYLSQSRAHVVKDFLGKWVVYRMMHGKEYRLLRHHEFLGLKRDVNPDDELWFECEEDCPNVLHFRHGELYAKHKTSVNQLASSKEYQVIRTEYMVDGEFVQRHRLKKLAGGLSTLAWFQPLETITATTHEKKLVGIQINHLDLSFKMIDDDQSKTSLAYCQDSRLSGYYICKNQANESLLDLSHYLLVENHHGDKRVLVPKLSQSELLPKFLLRESAKLPSSHLLDHVLDSALSSYIHRRPDRYLIYSLDRKGKLTSEDPESLAYLILLSLTKGDRKETLKLFSQIEVLGRREAIPSHVIEMLDLMIVYLGLAGAPDSERIVLKYEVMRIRSGLIHQDKPYASNPYDMIRWLIIQLKYSNYLRKLQSHGVKYLSVQDELLIFEGIKNVSPKKVLEFLTSQIEDISKILPTELFRGLGQAFQKSSSHGLSLVPILAMRKNDLQLLTQDENLTTLLATRGLIEAIYGHRGLPITSINVIPRNPLSLLMGLTVSNNDTRSLLIKCCADLKKSRNHSVDRQFEGFRYLTELNDESLSLNPLDLTPGHFSHYFPYFYQMVLSDDFDASLKSLLPWLAGQPRCFNASMLFKCLRVIAEMKKSKHPLIDSLVDPELLIDLSQLTWFEKHIEAMTKSETDIYELADATRRFNAEFNAIKKKWIEKVDTETYRGGETIKAIVFQFHKQLKPYRAASRKGKEPLDSAHDPVPIKSHALKVLPVLQGVSPAMRQFINKNQFSYYHKDMAEMLEEAISSHSSYEPKVLVCLLREIAHGELDCSEMQYTQLLERLDELYSIYESKTSPKQALRLLLFEIFEVCHKASPTKTIMKVARKRLFEEACSVGGKWGASWLVKEGLYQCTGLGPYRWIQFFADLALKGTNVGYKALGGAWEAQARAKKMRREIKPKSMIDTTRLMDEALADSLRSFDDKIDRLKMNILEEYFDVNESDCARADRAMPYEALGSLPIVTAFERLNRSLKEYYEREVTASLDYQMKPGKTVEELSNALTRLKNQVSSWLKQERSEIKEFINQSSMRYEESTSLKTQLEQVIVASRPLTFKEMQRAFVQQNDDFLITKLGGSRNQLTKFHSKMYQYHVMASRWALLFDEFDKTTEDLTPKRINRIGKELSRKRIYSFHEAPEHLIRGKLAFELGTRTLLRETQSRQMDALLTSPHKNQVIEMIMGSGKTFYGTRIAAYFEANGAQAVFNIWPSSVATTNIRECTRDVQKIYSQSGNALSLSRMTNWSERKLWAIVKLLEGSVSGREQNNTTKESLQAFELCFLEQAIDPQMKFRGLEEKIYWRQLEHFRQALLLIGDKGKGLIEEFHVAADNRKELNHPIGKAKTVEERFAVIIEDVLYKLLKNREIKNYLSIGGDKPSPMSQEKYRETILPLLAEEVTKLKILNIPEEERESYFRYISGTRDEIPEFVINHKRRSELALVKGLLTLLIPNALEKTIHVDYNPSKKGNGEYARPSDGNDNPLEESTIRSPYEAIVKTGLMLAHDGLKPAQVDKLIEYLRVRAEQRLESEQKSGDYYYRKTPEVKFFNKLFKNCPHKYDLKSLNDEERHDIHEYLKHHEKAILTYLRVHLISEILYYPLNLSSNSSNFISMFHSIYGDTGTPYNSGCYPGDTEVLYDQGTDGETLDILNQRIEDIIVLDEEAPEKVLDEIIEQFILPDENIRAVIDRGAAFNGLSSECVARQLLDKSPERIKGVAYYHDREKVVLLRNSHESVPFYSAGLTAEERLSYFPQPQTYAADIPQAHGSIGIVTIGEDTTFMELAQAVWRMRGLKTEDQKILFLITKRVQELICPEGGVPDERDLVAFTMKNQASQLAENTFQADKQKMHNVVRRAILDKALNMDEIQETVQLLREFQELFIRPMEDDPWDLFGGIDLMVPPEQIFAKIYANYEERLSRTESLSEGEKELILMKLRGVRKMGYRLPMLKTVRKIIEQNGSIPTELMPLFIDDEFTENDIFEDLREQWMDLIDWHVTFKSEEEKERAMQELRLIGEDRYPELVHTYQVYGEIKAGALDDMGMESHIEVDHRLDEEVEEEVDMNLQVEKNEESDRIDDHPHNQVKPQVRFYWPKTLDLSNLDWLVVSKAPDSCGELGSEHLKSVFRRFKKEIPIFTLKDAMAKAENKSSQVVAKFLSENILVTNNVCHLLSSIGAPIEPFGRYQVPIQEALVIQNESQIQLLLIDKEETRYWRERLKKSREENIVGPGLAIVDISTQAIMAEGYNKLTTDLSTDESYQKAVTQIKFLRGDVHYSKHQKHDLSQLLSHDLKTFKKYFHEVHRYHKTQPLLGSPLEKVILKLEGTKVKIRV